MHERHRHLFERALDGRLTPAEAEALRRLLAERPVLEARLERERRLSPLLHTSRAEALPPGFADRVMRHVQTAPAPAQPAAHARRAERTRTRAEAPFADALIALFRRYALAPAAVALLLLTYNVYVGHALAGPGASLLETTFALPPVSLETLLTL